MTNAIEKVFQYSGKTLRVENIDGQIWFVAKDVGVALGYPTATTDNVTKLIAHVPEAWKGRYRLPTPGGVQELLCLSEQGFYFFVARSDKPAALPFQQWVAGEVLPSIRATGQYTLPSPVATPAKTTISLLLEAVQALADQEQRLLAQEQKHAEIIAAHNELADVYDDLEARVSRAESREELAVEVVLNIPPPQAVAAAHTDRMKVRQMVENFARSRGGGVWYQRCWQELYLEFDKRYHTTLTYWSQKTGLSKIEYIDFIGKMGDLYAVAYEKYGVPLLQEMRN
jgi:prophage antirepressor-like protein